MEAFSGRFHSSPEEEPQAGTMTDLEKAIHMFIDLFNRYMGLEGCCWQSLSKHDLKALLQKELPIFLQSGKDAKVDKLLRDLDANGDHEVDFTEFMMFIAALKSTCHPYLQRAG